jgi:hypothetical protein
MMQIENGQHTRHARAAVPPWLMLVAVLLVAGCEGTDGRVPVQGTLTLDGAPAAGVSVAFHPSPETKGNGGRAQTDAAGRFTATTHQLRPGLYPGEYAITLTTVQPSSGQPADDSQERMPAPYAQAESTPLKISIDGRQGPLALEATSAK